MYPLLPHHCAFIIPEKRAAWYTAKWELSDLREKYHTAFLEDMKRLLKEEYPAFERALDERSEIALRFNPIRANAQALFPGEITGRVAWEACGRYVAAGFRPGKDPLHAAGGYYMQDASAMAPARVLDAQPGERVLDLCAAPGGKSGQLALSLGGAGYLIANEPDAKRARVLAGNLERLGAGNTAVVSAYPEQLAKKWAGGFDAVLVDAPCSGEGMKRRDETARKEWSPERAAGCAQRQKAILMSAASMVAPGGRLVYSTCTFNQGENEENIKWLLGERRDFRAGAFELPGVGASADGCLRLWPHRARGEGHFVALIRRDGARGEVRMEAPRAGNPEAQAFELVRKTLPGAWANAFSGWELTLDGEWLWAAPPGMPRMDGLKALARGVMLARVKRGYVEPCHQLAMAVEPGTVERRAEVDAQRYLRGEALAGDVRGWVLATWHGLALGWVKGADGMLKNHLPKGLRQR